MLQVMWHVAVTESDSNWTKPNVISFCSLSCLHQTLYLLLFLSDFGVKIFIDVVFHIKEQNMWNVLYLIYQFHSKKK